MTYVAVALVMFILGYLCGTFGAAVGIWAEREKAKLVIDGMAVASRQLLVAVGELTARPGSYAGPRDPAEAAASPENHGGRPQSLSSSRGVN